VQQEDKKKPDLFGKTILVVGSWIKRHFIGESG
jgi:hypothetical protein